MLLTLKTPRAKANAFAWTNFNVKPRVGRDAAELRCVTTENTVARLKTKVNIFADFFLVVHQWSRH